MYRFPPDSSYCRTASRVGDLWLVASAEGLHALLFANEAHKSLVRHALTRLREDPSHPVLKTACAQLREYFRGGRRHFDLALAPQGTQFQLRAWRKLSRIPFGQTISYAEQARRLGDVKKARAVGVANSRNPLPIIVPCHRVISSSGALSGFGGGVHIKRALLKLEGAGSALDSIPDRSVVDGATNGIEWAQG